MAEDNSFKKTITIITIVVAVVVIIVIGTIAIWMIYKFKRRMIVQPF